MKVCDSEHYAWFLFEEEGAFFLDANCNHSFFGYNYMIQLSPAETEQYRQLGRAYLTQLAYDIHYSAPIVKGSTSIYKGRCVAEEYREKCRAAVDTWNKSRPTS